MKKHFLLAVFTVIAGQFMTAADFNVNEINYNVVSETDAQCSVAIGKYEGDIVIPAQVEHNGTTYSVVSIDKRAFESTGITSVTIPATVTTIQKSAFAECRSLTKLVIEDSNTPMDVSYADGWSFTGMWTESPLETLYLGRELTYNQEGDYGFSPFWRVMTLTDVSFGPDITVITPRLFRECNGLLKVTVPEGVVRLDDYAFEFCEYMTEINLPTTLTELGAGVFTGCDRLADINFDPSNPYFSAKDLVLFSADGKDLIMYLSAKTASKYTVPAGTERILAGAFGASLYLKEIVVSEGVTEIGDNAMGNMLYLASVTLPESLTKLGNSVFSNCPTLGSMTIPEACTELGTDLFAGCHGLKNVKLPAAITYLPDGILSNCSGLEYYEIPAAVTGIGNRCFSSCASLWGVEIPTEVTAIGNEAFNGCGMLRYAPLPEKLRTIGASAFEGTALTSVILPESVESVGRYGFGQCINLTKFKLSPAMQTLSELTFWRCAQLREIIIPDNIETVEDNVFESCEGLESVTIGSGVKYMGNQVFNLCTSLKNVYIKDGDDPLELGWGGITLQHLNFFYTCPVEEAYVGRDLVNAENLGAFMTSKSIKTVTFGDKVKSVQENCLLNCENLEKVSFGESVTEIGTDALTGCKLITEVESFNTTAPANAAFELEVYKIAKLTIYDTAKESYATADGWKEFINVNTIPYSGIDDTYMESDEFSVIDGGIVFAPGVEGKVYNMSGVEVGNDNMTHGIYVVKTLRNSYKVSI